MHALDHELIAHVLIAIEDITSGSTHQHDVE
jgi:hypothetical protein